MSRAIQRILKVCLRFAPMLSGFAMTWPLNLCSTAFAPGTMSPSTSVVRKILFPQTIGCEWPRPAIGVFHLMFLSAPHSVGTFVSEETPVPSGPRHCDQLVAPGPAAPENSPNATGAIKHRVKAESVKVDARLIYLAPPVQVMRKIRSMSGQAQVSIPFHDDGASARACR